MTSRSETTAPMEMKYCKGCGETVPMWEFATNLCLDCVQASYTGHADRLKLPLAPKL